MGNKNKENNTSILKSLSPYFNTRILKSLSPYFNTRKPEYMNDSAWF